MKNFDWLQAFAMEQQEQPEPGVSADAAPQDEQKRAEAFRARSCMRSWKAPCSCALSCAAWMPEALTS